MFSSRGGIAHAARMMLTRRDSGTVLQLMGGSECCVYCVEDLPSHAAKARKNYAEPTEVDLCERRRSSSGSDRKQDAGVWVEPHRGVAQTGPFGSASAWHRLRKDTTHCQHLSLPLIVLNAWVILHFAYAKATSSTVKNPVRATTEPLLLEFRKRGGTGRGTARIGWALPRSRSPNRWPLRRSLIALVSFLER